MTDDSSASAGTAAGGFRQDIPVDRRANLDAVLYPPTSAGDPAGVEVAGAFVGIRVTSDGVVHVSLELHEAASWLRHADGTVAVQLTSGTDTLYAADVVPHRPSGEDTEQPPGKVIPLKGRTGWSPPRS